IVDVPEGPVTGIELIEERVELAGHLVERHDDLAALLTERNARSAQQSHARPRAEKLESGSSVHAHVILQSAKVLTPNRSPTRCLPFRTELCGTVRGIFP